MSLFFDEDGDLKVLPVIVGCLLGIVLFVLAINSFTVIDTGTRGVVTLGGDIRYTLTEGFHMVNPIAGVNKVTVSSQKVEVDASAASKDLQTVTAKVALTYRVEPNAVEQVYRTVRNDYESVIVAPGLQDSVKAATAQYTAEELITKRQQVRDAVMTNLRNKYAGTGITVNDFNITDFDFSPQFNAAIESKVTAEQKAKEAENKLKQVEAEAKQSVARAEAEAQAIRLQGDAANSSNYIRLKELEVQQSFAAKWNGVACQTNCWGSATGPIPVMQLGNQQ